MTGAPPATGPLVDERAPGQTAIDRQRLVAWLDSVLREGSEISVADDSPFLLDDSPRVARSLLMVDGRPAAHAAAYEITIDLPSGPLRAAIVGAVATDPEFRRRGFGSRVMEQVVETLAAREVPLAILWADVPRFYRQLGFVLAGRETIFICQSSSWHGPRRVRVRAAGERDLPAIVELHGRERCKVRRDEATWATLFALPRTDFYVLEREHDVLAYGVVGRGHDLRGCLHEWGGNELLLPTLVSGVAAIRDERELYVMSPPWKRQAARAMAYHRTARNSGALGMLRVLDRPALLRALGIADRELPAAHDDLVRAVFGCPSQPEPPDDAPLPVPFYLFGLDSM
jgi:GNAT superfamily N-acetyltransferase